MVGHSLHLKLATEYYLHLIDFLQRIEIKAFSLQGEKLGRSIAQSISYHWKWNT